jgi:hypothetical protein
VRLPRQYSSNSDCIRADCDRWWASLLAFLVLTALVPDLTTYFTRTHALERNLENLAFALAMLKDAADFFTSQLYGFALSAI